MRRWAFVLLLLAAAAPTGRETIGIWGRWGAFREPGRCFAIARPVTARRGDGFASVGDWPTRGLRSSFHLHLSRPRDPAQPVTLTIGERRFALVGTAGNAWAADRASDRAIVGAMRGGRSMSADAVAPGGRAFTDAYALAGAATAIDAAALACSPR